MADTLLPSQPVGPSADQLKAVLASLVPDYLRQNPNPPDYTANAAGKMPAVETPPAEQAVRGGIDLASNFTPAGGAKMAGSALAKMAPDVLHAIFAGPMAKTADLAALDAAKGMAKQSLPRGEILKQTGWFKNPGGKWSYEIADKGAHLNFPNEDTYLSLSGTMTHPDLYKAYPDLGYYEAATSHGPLGGEYDLGHKLQIQAPDNKGLYKGLLHETQHAVDKIEDFPPGSNPDWLYKHIIAPALKGQGMVGPEAEAKGRQVAFNTYQRHAGEVGARNTEVRSPLNAQSRRTIPPWTTADVSEGDQILPHTWTSTQPPEVQAYIRSLMGK